MALLKWSAVLVVLLVAIIVQCDGFSGHDVSVCTAVQARKQYDALYQNLTAPLTEREPLDANTVKPQSLRMALLKSFWSGCSEETFLEDFQELQPFGHHVFVNVGCNKGYNVGEFVDLFAPKVEFNNTALFNVFQSVLDEVDPLYKNLCGFCNDCQTFRKRAAEAPYGESHVTVYCLEPGAVNFELLGRAAARLTKVQDRSDSNVGPYVVGSVSKGDTSFTWHVLRTAASNRPGVLNFTAKCNHNKCSLADNGEPVAVTTVDKLSMQYSIPRIHYLKIDVEGFDPLVLFGATRMFAQQRVDLVVFEYHDMNLWPKYSLRGVVDWLHASNYICYLTGPVLTRLTGCWVDEYEFYGWSNVACVRSGHRLHVRMEQRSFMHGIKDEHANTRH